MPAISGEAPVRPVLLMQGELLPQVGQSLFEPIDRAIQVLRVGHCRFEVSDACEVQNRSLHEPQALEDHEEADDRYETEAVAHVGEEGAHREEHHHLLKKRNARGHCGERWSVDCRRRAHGLGLQAVERIRPRDSRSAPSAGTQHGVEQVEHRTVPLDGMSHGQIAVDRVAVATAVASVR